MGQADALLRRLLVAVERFQVASIAQSAVAADRPIREVAAMLEVIDPHGMMGTALELRDALEAAREYFGVEQDPDIDRAYERYNAPAKRGPSC